MFFPSVTSNNLLMLRLALNGWPGSGLKAASWCCFCSVGFSGSWWRLPPVWTVRVGVSSGLVRVSSGLVRVRISLNLPYPTIWTVQLRLVEANSNPLQLKLRHSVSSACCVSSFFSLPSQIKMIEFHFIYLKLLRNHIYRPSFWMMQNK